MDEKVDRDNPPDTLKIKGLPQLNEKEYALYMYNTALKAMIDSPTEENIKAFGEANRKMFEIEDAYRIGGQLLVAHELSHSESKPRPRKTWTKRFSAFLG